MCCQRCVCNWSDACRRRSALCGITLLLLLQVAQHKCGSQCLCRWQGKLPEEVRAAGRCGAPCPLFWPCSPDYEPPALGEWDEGLSGRSVQDEGFEVGM